MECLKLIRQPDIGTVAGIKVIKDTDLVFENEYGNPREPLPEEISYFRYGVFAPDTDFENRIVVVDETTINSDQIF